MTEHRWSGWPGAWCLDCGVEDPVEAALADPDRPLAGRRVVLTDAEIALLECPEPGSNRYNPYTKETKHA